MSEKSDGFNPGELKFFAEVNGQIVRDGDYWSPQNGLREFFSSSYPVRISSLGIHYTKKQSSSDEVIVKNDGTSRSYYSDWEQEIICSEGVRLYVSNPDIISSFKDEV
jgi:hypothetical protein